MARAGRVSWPTGPRTVFFDDMAGSTTLSKAVGEGRIRRLAPKIYTTDMASEPAEIVRANPWRILAKLLPAAVIVDRSAAEGGRISNGTLFVAAETQGIVGIRRVRRSRRLGVAVPELWRTQHRHRRCADVNGVAPRRR